MNLEEFLQFKDQVEIKIIDACIVCGKTSEYSVIGNSSHVYYCKKHYYKEVKNGKNKRRSNKRGQGGKRGRKRRKK